MIEAYGDDLVEETPSALSRAEHFKGQTKADLIFGSAVQMASRGHGASPWQAITGDATDASAFAAFSENPIFRDELRRSALAHGHAGPSVDIAITLAKASRGDQESVAALEAMRVDLGAWLERPGAWRDHRHSALKAFAGSIDSGLRGGDWNWAIGVALHQNSTTQQFLDPMLGGVIGGMAGAVTRAAPWRRVIFRNERAAANGGDDWTRADYMAAGRCEG